MEPCNCAMKARAEPLSTVLVSMVTPSMVMLLVPLLDDDVPSLALAVLVVVLVLDEDVLVDVDEPSSPKPPGGGGGGPMPSAPWELPPSANDCKADCASDWLRVPSPSVSSEENTSSASAELPVPLPKADSKADWEMPLLLELLLVEVSLDVELSLDALDALDEVPPAVCNSRSSRASPEPEAVLSEEVVLEDPLAVVDDVSSPSPSLMPCSMLNSPPPIWKV